MKSYISDNKDRFLDELMEMLRIPSVSADPAFKGDVLKMAELTKQSLLFILPFHQLINTQIYLR